MTYRDTELTILNYNSMVGMIVVKCSKKPFKSGNKENTVKGITTNEHTQRVAFTFYEDDSNVECFKCKLLNVV